MANRLTRSKTPPSSSGDHYNIGSGKAQPTPKRDAIANSLTAFRS